MAVPSDPSTGRLMQEEVPVPWAIIHLPHASREIPANLRPTFTSREMLERVTGIPVLGSVTIAIRETLLPWYRRQGVMVAGAFGMLLGAYLLNIVLTDHLRIALRKLVG